MHLPSPIHFAEYIAAKSLMKIELLFLIIDQSQRDVFSFSLVKIYPETE